MNTSVQRLQAYLQEQHIQAEHLSFDQPCHSVAEAARAVNASPQELVKNICLLDSDGQLITAIVKGEDRNLGKNRLSMWRNSLIRISSDVPD